ncbi:MAG: hypothetical protein Q4A32_06755 [Lachnospiraceae bacterium]|nr:hypothetical protein [Lachnospiraceae bacterium]
MFNIRDELLRLFGADPASFCQVSQAGESNRESYAADGEEAAEGGTANACREQGTAHVSESGGDYSLKLVILLKSVPSAEEMEDFLRLPMPWDKCTLTIHEQGACLEEDAGITINGGLDGEAYAEFAGKAVLNAPYSVSLYIEKGLAENGVRSVYDWCAFSEFLLGRSSGQNGSAGVLPDYLNGILTERPDGICFLVLDEEIEYSTKTITFANAIAPPKDRKGERLKELKRYNEASLFMGRMNNVLLPGDFHESASSVKLPDVNGHQVKDLFNRYETVYSLLYLAAISWLESGSLFLELQKGGMRFAMPVSSIRYNSHICDLAAWAFDAENATERAEIARQAMAFYCRNAEDIQNIGEGVLQSAVASYQLHQKGMVERYINLKKGLSDSILASTKQVQELVSSLVGNLEKNFVAVTTLIVTQILAKHIKWENLGQGSLGTEEFKAVLLIFSISSLLYLAATILTVDARWEFYKERYDLLRRQYEDLLDKATLDKAFQDDLLLKNAKKKLDDYKVGISCLWVVLIAAVWVLGAMV